MYTYLVGWKKLDKWYYGSRVANKKPPIEDLFCEYFTSSNSVKLFIKEHGTPDTIKIHKEFESAEDCRAYEEKFLKFVDVTHKTKWLNKNDIHAPPILFGADNGFFQKTHSDETKARWSRDRVGKTPTDETRKKLCGRVPWNKGKTDCFSEETRMKLSISLTGKTAWNKGKIGCFSEETLMKMSLAKLGRGGNPHTNESKSNLSKKRMGKKWFYDPITLNCVCREKCPNGYVSGLLKKSNGRTGYKHSEETKLKMSISAKSRRQNDCQEN